MSRKSLALNSLKRTPAHQFFPPIRIDPIRQQRRSQRARIAVFLQLAGNRLKLFEIAQWTESPDAGP